MGARMPDPVRHALRRPTVTAALIGAILAGGVVFLLMWHDPMKPGPCAEAAERWAQVDETAKWEYWEHTAGAHTYVPSDGLVVARGEARAKLAECRAAGS